MSVFIKEFDIPKTCNECPFKINSGSDSFLCLALRDTVYSGNVICECERYDDCPLIGVGISNDE